MNTIAIKAGMDKIDKAKVEAIIEKMSRDSPHYEKVWIGVRSSDRPLVP